MINNIEYLCVHNLLGFSEERIFFKDLQGRYMLVSRGWLEAEGRGRSLEEVIGRSDSDLFTKPRATAVLEDEQWIIGAGEPIIGKMERETYADHTDSWVATNRWPLREADGRIVGTFGISRDVTAVMHDAATGLANRSALLDRLRHSLAGLDRQPGRLALLFLDIDGFKEVNDRFGHRVGDRVLGKIARRLTRVSRRIDTVSRYGGDEFVLLCAALRDDDNLRLIGERAMHVVSAPIDVDGCMIRLTSSVGAVSSDDSMSDPEELLERGDAAMYAAKRAGGARFVVHDGQLQEPFEQASLERQT